MLQFVVLYVNLIKLLLLLYIYGMTLIILNGFQQPIMCGKLCIERGLVTPRFLKGLLIVKLSQKACVATQKSLIGSQEC